MAHTQDPMRQAVDKGDCLDVNAIGRPWEGFEGEVWLLDKVKRFDDGKDYCDLAGQRWILSVGRSKSTGQYFAATTTRFYQSPYFECVWLR